MIIDNDNFICSVRARMSLSRKTETFEQSEKLKNHFHSIILWNFCFSFMQGLCTSGLSLCRLGERLDTIHYPSDCPEQTMTITVEHIKF